MNNKEKPYSFWPSEAVQYGLEKAVILYNLRFWLTVNKAAGKEKHYHDGKWWTYNTAKALENLMPFFNRRSIARWMSELEADGVLLSGSFNKVAYDRTKWYTIPSEFSDDAIGQNDQCNGQDGQSSGQNGQPIPDCNPVDNPDENLMSPTGSTAPEGADSVCSLCLGYEWTHGNQCERCSGTGKEPVVNSELTTDQPKAPSDTAEPVGQTEHEAAPADRPIKTLNVPFDDFWNLYNKKVGRKKSEAKWKRLSNKDRTAIMEHLPNYIRNTPDVQYRKNPETYLNNESWNDELPNMGKTGRPEYPENQGVDSSIHTSQMNPNKPGLRYGEEAQFVTELTDEHKANNEKMRGNLQDLLKGFDE